MPEASSGMGWLVRRRKAELALVAIAALVFLGRLGALDLGGKREQRASAEALDTVDHNNWLVAYIQCRPRLEKPPLPRWTIATLMKATGVRDEWIVRLPNALTAVFMVGLVYGLGRRIGGRSVGLASGLALCSTVFFVIESRQAGNDGPLAFFTTLSLYAAFRRLHGGLADEPCGLPGDRLGSWNWTVLMWAAIGLGFLSKGPISIILPALAIVPYLILARRFKLGARALFSAIGLALFVLLALSWPVPVLLRVKDAAEIWMLEMGQKAGTAGITHHHQRYFLSEWPWLTAPWTLLATFAVALPFVGRGRADRPTVWFPWFWAVGNFAMFCLWSVAKPNYYVPCEPGVALLVGLAWVRLAEIARSEGRAAARARRLIQFHWVALIVAAIAGPIVARSQMPESFGRIAAPLTVASVAAVVGVALSIRAWRRREDVTSFSAMVGGLCVALAILFGAVGPALNGDRSHRGLADQLDRVLPRDVSTVMFFHELDEGLWFYLKDRTLAPVPGSIPKFNNGYDLVQAQKDGTLIWDEAGRIQRDREILVKWLAAPSHESPFVLIRSKVYDQFGPGLEALAEPVFREPELKRNGVMLLRVRDHGPVAGAPRPSLK